MELRFVNITKHYGTTRVLTGISGQVPSGTSLAVTGVSGRGKSTLLHILGGIDTPTAGQVFWGPDELTGGNARHRERLRLKRSGILPQDPCLDLRLSARDNCLLPAAFRRVAGLTERVDALLDQAGLGKCANLDAGKLSGGQAVRTALVRALAIEPDVLIADEPTGTLDPDTASTVIDLVLSLAANHGTTVVLATHDMDLAQRCDQCLALGAV